jgi:hypothetical protein
LTLGPNLLLSLDEKDKRYGRMLGQKIIRTIAVYPNRNGIANTL